MYAGYFVEGPPINGCLAIAYLHSPSVAASYNFDGRTALITGGAGDIGAAVARRLLAAGAQVATLDLRAAEFGGVLALSGDVSRSGDVDAAVRRIEAELGPLAIAVCAAGISGESLNTADVPDEEWRRVFSINCDGVFFANRAAARAMVPRGYGRIVNVASIAGKEGNPTAAAYSASKAAVIAMTKSIGKDLAETGVLVNCVAPAVIETRMLGDMSDEHVAYMVERIPMRRMGQPEEVAALIAFLASEECSFSTGAAFDISGGRATY
jgi:2-dehydro-3-deoxy-L-rhamnonate dehydrogenase (NAD+)